MGPEERDILGNIIHQGDDKDNEFTGTSENEANYGEAGNDTFHGSGGRDHYNGGADIDTAIYGDLPTNRGIQVETHGSVTDIYKDGRYNQDQTDRLYDIEAIGGTEFGDTFKITKIEGEQYYDGANGTDTLDLNLVSGFVGPDAKDFTFVNVPEGPDGKPEFNGKPYDAMMTDGNGNTLYINDIENINIHGVPANLDAPFKAVNDMFSQNDTQQATFGGQETLSNQSSEAGIEAYSSGESVAMLGNIGRLVNNLTETLNASGANNDATSEIQTNGASEVQNAINSGALNGISNILGELNEKLQQGADALNVENPEATTLPSAEDLSNTLGEPFSTFDTTNTNTVMHENMHAIGGPPQADTYTLSTDDAILMLNQARESMNASGIESELRDVINHPGADAMLETLKANGVESLNIHAQPGLSPEDQIQSILEAGRDETIEQGLEMPTVLPETQVPNAEVIQEYGAADEDYGIV